MRPNVNTQSSVQKQQQQKNTNKLFKQLLKTRSDLTPKEINQFRRYW